MTSSFIDLTGVNTGKANGINKANLAEARRQFQAGAINSAKKHQAQDNSNAWKMASTPYNAPWMHRLDNSIQFEPKEIYENTKIKIAGLDNGSTIFLRAGALVAAGFTIHEIMDGIEWDDVAEMIERNDIQPEYLM